MRKGRRRAAAARASRSPRRCRTRSCGRLACTALSARLNTARWIRSSSPSTISDPAQYRRRAATCSVRAGCVPASAAAPRTTAARSTGSRRVTRTRAKSRNSESRRERRSDSRTIRLPSVLSSLVATGRADICSTALRIDASGFFISCASDAESSATASSLWARRLSCSRRFWSEMSWKIAVALGPAPAPSPSADVVVTPNGKVRSMRTISPSARIAFGWSCAE